MKKNVMIFAAASMMALAISACGSKTEATTAAATEAATTAAEETTALSGEQEAVYTLKNTTGETVKELYIYPADSSDKGENYAADGMDKDATVTVSKKADASEIDGIVYNLSFKTESGYEGSFTTLHFETVTIELLSSDAVSGATQIKFET